MKTNKQIQNENRIAFGERVKAAHGSKVKLELLEKKITRFYDQGLLSAQHLSELDSMIMVRIIKLDLELAENRHLDKVGS